MDILKRSLAPLTDEAWKEIETRAQEVFESYLSARKFIHVEGPLGWNYTVLAEGRLTNIEGKDGEVYTGIYEAKPLIETRINFELSRWEMDNLIRGAKDIDLSPLEEAARKSALFEENVLYNGHASANIQGLQNASSHKPLPFGNNGSEIMDAITEGMLLLKRSFTKKPYTLVVGKETLKRIQREIQGDSLNKRITELLGGDIVYSEVADGALLVPYDHEDLEMTIGRDFSIGYETADEKRVQLFITESFTFRILDPDLIVKFTI
ncbi:MAG: Linocin bacteriocin protein [Defluviitaleaceae bacterium]|jgi:uncharacterized linocin/CFP29 family protein|nr:Linocin bacteriocin protein [Defluviitaleaceae bacterium]